MLNLDNFYKARYVLKSAIHKTDLVHAVKINPECDVYLKPENLQNTGSFKIRGAYYKISQLTDEEKAKGVIARLRLHAVMVRTSALCRVYTMTHIRRHFS